MKFFEDLGATLGTGAKAVADKTKEISGVAAIKAQIGTAEASLGKLYKDLGKAYYEDHKESAAYGEKMSEIAAVLAKIDALNAKLSSTQGVKKCPACGEAMAKDSTFCPKCGAKVESFEEVEEVKEVAQETTGEEAAEE